MKNIRTKQYSMLSDHMDIYNFMVDIYEIDCRNGAAAPFHEYALSSSWMDKEYVHRFRIWKDEDLIVGFCFTEDSITDIYFCLRPGYEELAEEMVTYASKYMPNVDNNQRFVLFRGQTALIEASKLLGYVEIASYTDMIFTFDKELAYELPKGFKFVDNDDFSIEKLSECCYKGFNHEEEDGPWDGDIEHHYALLQAPHATPQHAVIIENEQGEYVCFAGMWWTPANKLAYMEPLCTISEYRNKGLAAAALSELYKRMKKLGATHMTGGANEFYKKIGFVPMIEEVIFKKQ